MTITFNLSSGFIGPGLHLSGTTDTTPPDLTDVQVYVYDPTETHQLATAFGFTHSGGAFGVTVGEDALHQPTDITNGWQTGDGVHVQVFIVGYDSTTVTVLSWDGYSGLWNLVAHSFQNSATLDAILAAVRRTY